jgi:glucose/arabinose dehydrogenase
MLLRIEKLIVIITAVGIIIGVIFVVRSNLVQEKIYIATHPPEVSPTPAPGKILTGVHPPFSLKLTDGFQIGIFAHTQAGGRDLQFSPGGTLLVSIPSQGKVLALPDTNGDGVADQTIEILTGLNGPHGIAFNGGKLFVAQETEVDRYLWDDAHLSAKFEKKIVDLPKVGNHVTRSLEFSKTGQLFISIGSSCNVCNETDPRYATILVTDSEGMTPQIFAKGLRNSVFVKTNPTTGALWATDMGRDYLGDNNPPDEVNIILENHDYGWPLCWGNKIHDTQFDKNTYISDPCANTQPPQYGITAHAAPLGLNFIHSPQFPPDWQGDLLVSEHGSWNRTSPIGYKIIHLKLNGNNIVSEEDFLSGFLGKDGATVFGRPVDLEFDSAGSLYISDDKANQIYKIIKI